jgi:hypothetical protein
MRLRSLGRALPVAALIALPCGCSETPEGWTPVLEETSTAFLETSVERAQTHLAAARTQLAEDPRGADADLSAAEAVLDHLSDYYLPLLRAREGALNAYRYHYLEQPEAWTRQLDAVEENLLAVAEAAQSEDTVLREISEIMELLSDARVASVGASGDAAAALEALARRLDLALLKGDMELPDSR